MVNVIVAQGKGNVTEGEYEPPPSSPRLNKDAKSKVKIGGAKTLGMTEEERKRKGKRR